MKGCKYCYEHMSHGNEPIIDSDKVKVYVVYSKLFALVGNDNIAQTEDINYCPKCGRELLSNERGEQT